MDTSVKYKQRLYIYDRREMVVLVLLIGMISAFAFTLGIHLEKRAVSQMRGYSVADTPLVHTLSDEVPDRLDLDEQSRGAEEALTDSLTQMLHEEVARTGIRLDTPHQVDLPEKTRSSNEGATTLKSLRMLEELGTHSGKFGKFGKFGKTGKGVERNVASEEKYTLQVGSYPTQKEAERVVSELKTKFNLHSTLREVEIAGKGKRFRLYLGHYSSHQAAEKAGEKYHLEHKIASFMVSKEP